MYSIMAALQPLVEPNIFKKRSKQFWHQSDRYLTLEQNWQKPRIISNRVQRRLKNNILMPKIDDGSSKETKHTLPIGFRKFLVLVRSWKCSRSYCAQSFMFPLGTTEPP